MLYFTTLFDSNYLPKGIVLYKSLLKVVQKKFKIFLLCLDEETYIFFTKNKKDFEHIELIKISDFENKNPELFSVRLNRSLVEYYFTLSPILPLYLIENFNLDHICSMDADLFFYSSPEIIFESLDEYSIIITPHKFSKELDYLKKYGLYNVSFQIFKNNEIGISCLRKWKNDCLEWCKDEYDEKFQRFADQKYLDNWKIQFSNSVLELNEPDTGLAIWNINNYKLSYIDNNFLSNGNKVIFYHFHNFKSITTKIAINGFYNYKVNVNKTLNNIYDQYWKNLNIVVTTYNIKIDKSIRLKQSSTFLLLLNECSFYYNLFKKIYLFNLKFVPKIFRKLITRIYG